MSPRHTNVQKFISHIDPAIERIWREKREVAHVSIAIGGKVRRMVGAAILRAETGRAPKGI